MPKGKSLSDEQNTRLREVVRDVLMPKFDNNQSALAPALDLKQGTLSAFLRGLHGGSYPLALRAAELAGVDPMQILGHAVRPANVVEYEHVRSPTFGALPGWAEAEAEARVRYSKVPPEAWEGARSMSGFSFPERGRVTPDFVRAAARAWEEMQERLEELARETPDKKAADRAEERRLEAMHDELEASKRRK